MSGIEIQAELPNPVPWGRTVTDASGNSSGSTDESGGEMGFSPKLVGFSKEHREFRSLLDY